MSGVLAWFQFPILTRELTEQAARRRTYMLRAGLAVLLWFVILLMNADNLNAARDRAGGTGSGAQMLRTMQLIYFGLALLVPAIASDVFTAEKERGTLGLLLLTRLTGGQLVVQKFLSRYVLILSTILPAIPLLALAYTLGGVSAPAILFSAAGWILCAAQLAALSVFSSTISRSTLGATLLTYVLMVGMYVLPIVIVEFFQIRGLDLEETPLAFPARMAAELNLISQPRFEAFMGLWVPPIYEFHLNDSGRFQNASVWRAGALALYRSLPLWAGVALLLVLSRVFLWRCAFLPAKNWLALLQRNLDRFFKRINDNRITRGRILFEERGGELALFKPIAWLETQKRGLARIQHLIRFTLLIELPIVLLFVFYMMTGSDWDMRVLGAFNLWAVWIITAIYLATRGASLVNGDRSRQTLDALLTTPMGDWEIVIEKLRGARRVLIALWIPVGTQLLINTLLNGAARRYSTYLGAGGSFDGLRAVTYLACGALLYFTFTWCWTWICCWVGLLVRGGARATVTLILSYLLWTGALFTADVLPRALGVGRWNPDAYLFVSGPLLAAFGTGVAYLALPARKAPTRPRRAVLSLLAGVLFAVYVPSAFAMMFNLYQSVDRDWDAQSGEAAFYWTGSPLGAMIRAELPTFPWPFLLIWLPPLALLGWGLRTRCLTEFSKCVGRIDADR